MFSAHITGAHPAHQPGHSEQKHWDTSQQAVWIHKDKQSHPKLQLPVYGLSYPGKVRLFYSQMKTMISCFLLISFQNSFKYDERIRRGWRMEVWVQFSNWENLHLHNLNLAAAVMASEEKTACYLFCRVPFSCVVQATGETKNLLLVTPCIKALETWILFVLFCGGGHAHITRHKWVGCT